MRLPRICVIGASNIDLVTYAPRLPRLGETLPATRFATGFGGKGANQAVAAARLGGQVAMVTKVGDDIFGQDTRRNFEAQNIDTTCVFTTREAATGVAPIWVEESSGANAILVALGANDLLSPDDITQARPLIEAAKIVVCQWECPLETMLAALEIGRNAGALTIFNPAPARGELPAHAYATIDILCPNESETEHLTGMPVDDQEQALAAGRILLARGPRHVILTLGARGSLLLSADTDTETFVPAPAVTAVDTTGAGDAFVGSLAFFLAADLPLSQAIRHANQIAAISVQSPGTQTSFPYRHTLPADLFADIATDTTQETSCTSTA